MPPRRLVRFSFLLLLVAVVGAGAAHARAFARAKEPPTHAWLADHLMEGDAEILAYAVWDDVPRVVYRFRAGTIFADGRVRFDHLRLDYASHEWPFVPAWQLTGFGYALVGTTAPASRGVARCAGVAGEFCSGPSELFGQINDERIVAIEVLVDGSWRRFAVAAPGYVVRLDRAGAIPDAYRWLDRDGRVVWEADRIESVALS